MKRLVFGLLWNSISIRTFNSGFSSRFFISWKSFKDEGAVYLPKIWDTVVAATPPSGASIHRSWRWLLSTVETVNINKVFGCVLELYIAFLYWHLKSGQYIFGDGEWWHLSGGHQHYTSRQNYLSESRFDLFQMLYIPWVDCVKCYSGRITSVFMSPMSRLWWQKWCYVHTVEHVFNMGFARDDGLIPLVQAQVTNSFLYCYEFNLIPWTGFVHCLSSKEIYIIFGILKKKFRSIWTLVNNIWGVWYNKRAYVL